jgi:hypothetical protein
MWFSFMDQAMLSKWSSVSCRVEFSCGIVSKIIERLVFADCKGIVYLISFRGKMSRCFSFPFWIEDAVLFSNLAFISLAKQLRIMGPPHILCFSMWSSKSFC